MSNILEKAHAARAGRPKCSTPFSCVLHVTGPHAYNGWVSAVRSTPLRLPSTPTPSAHQPSLCPRPVSLAGGAGSQLLRSQLAALAPG